MADFCLRQHRSQVLLHRVQVHAHRAVGRAGEGARDHRPARLQHVRAARAVGQDVDHTCRVELQRFQQRQRFGQRLPIDHQRQVDRELHDCAGAQTADMFDAPTQHRQQRARAVQVFSRAANEAEQFALQGRPDAAADGAFEKACANRGRPRAQQRGLGRADGAHVDEQPARWRAGQQPLVAAVDLVLRRLVGEHRDHRLARCGQRARAFGPARAGIDERLRARRAAVPHHHRVPACQQAPRDRRAHLARACQPDLHGLVSCDLAGAALQRWLPSLPIIVR